MWIFVEFAKIFCGCFELKAAWIRVCRYKVVLYIMSIGETIVSLEYKM